MTAPTKPRNDGYYDLDPEAFDAVMAEHNAASFKAIARLLGVHWTTVSRLRRGKSRLGIRFITACDRAQIDFHRFARTPTAD